MRRSRVSVSGQRKIEKAIARGWRPGAGRLSDYLRRNPDRRQHCEPRRGR